MFAVNSFLVVFVNNSCKYIFNASENATKDSVQSFFWLMIRCICYANFFHFQRMVFLMTGYIMRLLTGFTSWWPVRNAKCSSFTIINIWWVCLAAITGGLDSKLAMWDFSKGRPSNVIDYGINIQVIVIFSLSHYFTTRQFIKLVWFNDFFFSGVLGNKHCIFICTP